MKRINFLILFVLLFGSTSIAQTPTVTQNFIMETVVRDSGITTLAQLDGLPVSGANRTMQYFDGLGRPLQTVQWKAGQGGQDIVQFYEYDSCGRETHRYLPYVEEWLGEEGSYRPYAKTQQAEFYWENHGWDHHVAKTPYPYAVTVFENSPLNRVLEQGAPGEAWQPAGTRGTTGRTVVREYGTNVGSGSERVRLWKVNNEDKSVDGTGYYVAGKLYKTVVKDENWTSGKSSTVEEYKDFSGRVVLKRIWESESKMLNTYYVYDDFGDLRYVVPPAVSVNSFDPRPSDSSFCNYIYAYDYDTRGRLIEKKIPGRGSEYIVYNRNDRPVLTQDSVQRAVKKWSYTKYDALGRVAETGIYTDTVRLTRDAMQDEVNSHKWNDVAYYWEVREGTANYTNHSFPIKDKAAYVVNYYDDYDFYLASTPALVSSAITERKSDRTKTMLTGTRVWHDDRSDSLLSLYYYDSRGRLIQTAKENHLGGTDIITNTYSFANELLTSKREHKASLSGTVTVVLTKNEYDHVGRLERVRHQVNEQNPVVLSRFVFNELGQVKNKLLHQELNQSATITSLSYVYNERGWITRMISPHFTEIIGYNNPSLGTTTKQFNGNISEQQWGHNTMSTPNRFVYEYDKLNRLLNGTSTGTVLSEVLTYDDIGMGNIKTLKRDNGTIVNYAYTGSFLTTLTGGLTGNYTYDANGNALTDRTGMTFTYNHLNLPKTATKTGTGVTYLYDAFGTKLRKISTSNGMTTQRDYIGGIEYSKLGNGGSTIEMIHTGEGYIQRNANNTYTYHYNLTDHLGNVRATLQRTTATTGTVIQKHDYYPFGKAKALVTSGVNKYLYNGKEVQQEIGGQYDYGFRFYDSEIGRWNVMDPLAEMHYNLTPYNYVLNNPINFVDPWGLDTVRSNRLTDDEWKNFDSNKDVIEIEGVPIGPRNNNWYGGSGGSYSWDGYGGFDDLYNFGKFYIPAPRPVITSSDGPFRELQQNGILSTTHRKSEEILNMTIPSPSALLQDKLTMSAFTDVKVLKSSNPFFNVNLVYDAKNGNLQVAGISVLGGLYGLSFSASGVISQSTKIGPLNLSLGYGINQEGVSLAGRVSVNTGSNSASGVSANYKMGMIGYSAVGALITRGASIPITIPAYLKYAF